MTTSVLAVAAIGLSLQFGITNYVNFAYGDFMALGAYLTFVLNNQVFHINIWVSVALATLLMGAFGVLINQFLLGPFARRFKSTHYVLIVTFGLSLVMLNVIYSIWGANVQFYSLPPGTAHKIGPLLLTTSQLVVMGIAVALLIAIHTILKTTRLG
ncbi:MAG: branched-chain amino acid ABC transporter permease, partial [Acidobacteriota bacterium]|nr:branched-chain amino acid ABC transporter permease [Acidobacteriota bacterium]